MPSITPTTLLVSGSITWTLSPALLVWMMRTFFCCAHRPAVQKATAATTMRHRPSACVLVVIVVYSSPEAHELCARLYFAAGPMTHVLKICHSASFCELQCLPPL